MAPPASEAGKPADGLPEFAKQAESLEAIKKAVDDAAAVGGGLWLSYLFVLFYLAVAAGAVTHQDLFFEHAVKLPFLTGIELPLVAFFALAPLIFVVVHAYALVHLVMLTDKAKAYHKALYEQMGDTGGLTDAERDDRKTKRDALRRQLPSNIFIQFLAGPSDTREGGFGWLLRLIAWITLAIAPILLLLMMQTQFLPYHSGFVIWTQRVALGLDLALIWWLWRRILEGRESDVTFGPDRQEEKPVGVRRRFSAWFWALLGLTLSLAVFLFSVTVVTFPGEPQEERLPSWLILPALNEWGDPATWTARGAPRKKFIDWVMNAEERVSLHDWLFNADPDRVTRRRFPFSSTLVLIGVNLYEGLGIDDPKKAEWHDVLFRAHGRNFRGAILNGAILPKVDFEPADLQGASLGGTQLQGASLLGAHLQGALLDGAQLQGASLFGAQLQGASLDGAQLQGASLITAQLQGASLNGAQLQGASLGDAQLQGASLINAQLQGASLQGAVLEATDLSGAFLWRTNGAGQPFPSQPGAIRMSGESWLAADGAYKALQKRISDLPQGLHRDQALERIQRLDCSNSDKTLSSCNAADAPPPEAQEWREALEKAARVDNKTYADSLAKILRLLACQSGDAATHVVGGVGFQSRLEAAGQLTSASSAASALIDDLVNRDSKNCPVAAALTDTNRAMLLQKKKEIEANSPGG